MPKSLAELNDIDTARENFRELLHRFPELATRIINHVDANESLVARLRPPFESWEVHLVNELARFARAAEDVQSEMVVLARECVAEHDAT